MPTERLYYADAYRLEFDGVVRKRLAGEKGEAGLVLDRSCFYPTGGGQLFDTGRLAGVPVVAVEDRAGDIVHWLQAAPEVDVGERVTGRVDAVRRRHHRQQHTGQHILSRVLEDRLGHATESARLGEQSNSIDLGAEALQWPEVEKVERASNDIVWAALPVHVELLEATGRGERHAAKADADGIVRLIEVEGIDRCPCGGTHVRNTAEIGLIACTRVESIARGTRLHFLCGERAFEYLRRRDRQLAELALRFTSGADQLLGKFERLEGEAKALKRKLAELRTAQSRARADSWIAEAEALELSEEGRVRALLRTVEPEELGAVSGRLARTDDLLTVLVAPGPERWQIVVARGSGLRLDCAAALRELLESVGGRGGGRPEQARGSFDGSKLGALLQLIETKWGLSAPDSLE